MPSPVRSRPFLRLRTILFRPVFDPPPRAGATALGTEFASCKHAERQYSYHPQPPHQREPMSAQFGDCRCSNRRCDNRRTARYVPKQIQTPSNAQELPALYGRELRLRSIENRIRQRAVSVPLARLEPSVPPVPRAPSAHSVRLPQVPRAAPCRTDMSPEQNWEIRSSSRKTGR